MGRVAQLTRQRPDATAVYRQGPAEQEVFDPDLWTPPNQRPPQVQYAGGIRRDIGRRLLKK